MVYNKLIQALQSQLLSIWSEHHSYSAAAVSSESRDNWKEYRIKMVSGTWLSPDDFDDKSNEWWH